VEIETYHIWIDVIVSDTGYRFEANTGQVTLEITLPQESAIALSYENFLGQLVRAAITDHKLKHLPSSPDPETQLEEPE